MAAATVTAALAGAAGPAEAAAVAAAAPGVGEACAVCLRPPLKRVTLHCGHTFCRKCTALWCDNARAGAVGEAWTTCPLCRHAAPTWVIVRVVGERVKDGRVVRTPGGRFKVQGGERQFRVEWQPTSENAATFSENPYARLHTKAKPEPDGTLTVQWAPTWLAREEMGRQSEHVRAWLDDPRRAAYLKKVRKDYHGMLAKAEAGRVSHTVSHIRHLHAVLWV